MAPRAYRLQKRAEAVDSTRRRIVDAVVELHGEKGILATSWEEIARRADVAPATVYRHFPTLDELVPACGGRIMQITAPPTPAIFTGLETLQERLAALVHGLFDFYERADRFLAMARCEADKVPALAAGLREQDDAHLGLVREALGSPAGDGEAVQIARALTDFFTWKAFSSTGMASGAAGIVSDLLLSRLTNNHSDQAQ